MFSENNPPKKICILRLSAIGDVTHVIPVVMAVQQQWPQTQITWICGQLEYKLLQIIPNVRFIVFDKSTGIKAYKKLWKELRDERFDVLMHMQVAARANIASMRIKAKVKLGWDKQRSRDLHQFFTSDKVAECHHQHQVQGFLSFARALGLMADEPQWHMPITQKAKRFVDAHINPDKRALVISACSSHKLRNWTPRRYAQVADYAIEHHNMQVILSGGPAKLEVDMAQDIANIMQHKPNNLVGMDTLEELVGLLSSAAVVLSPDSGPAHLANAVGTPVIGLYACTWSKRSGPYQSLEFCVDKFEQAAIKFRGKNANQLRWGTKIEQPGVMELIQVEEVCKQLDSVIKG